MADAPRYEYAATGEILKIDGLDIEEWRETAQLATARISSAEREAGLTQEQHMLRWLPEVRDKVLHPYPSVRGKDYTRSTVVAAFQEIEADCRARLEKTDADTEARRG